MIKKLAIYALSAFLGLAAVELAMRAAGAFLAWRMTGNPAGGTETVLCIGDSYTLGIDSPLKASYPQLLQKELDAADPGKYRVVNGGICEASTGITARALERQIEEFSPSIVVIMSGASNFFVGSINRDPGPEHGRGFFGSLRTVRLLKIAWMQFRASTGITSGEALDGEVLPLPHGRPGADPKALASLRRTWDLLSSWDMEAAHKECSSALSRHPEDINLHYTMIEIALPREGFDSALKSAETALGLAEAGMKKHEGKDAARDFALARSLILKRMSELHSFKYKFREAVSLMLKSLEYGPPHEEDFYRLVHAYKFQSAFSAGNIRSALVAAAAKNRELGGNGDFEKSLAYFSDTEKAEAGIAASVERDLRGMILRAKAAGAGVIVSNYPFPYLLAGRAIRAAADGESAVFLDMTGKFSSLTAPGKRDKYFHTNDHCTDEGNLIMARNLAPLVRSVSGERRKAGKGPAAGPR